MDSCGTSHATDLYRRALEVERSFHARRNAIFCSSTINKLCKRAFREVSDSLIAYQKIREVRTQRELLVETLRDRSRLSYLRYTGGVATLLDALDADRELFEAERSLALARRDELLSVVQLYKALGGGWQ